MKQRDWRAPLQQRYVGMVIVGVAAMTLLLTNIGLAQWSIAQPRLTSDYSREFLLHRLAHLAHQAPQILIFGDSVLWGYRVTPEQLMSARLAQNGIPSQNLSFKGSSPPNYYAMARLLKTSGVSPRFVLIEINQKVFNPSDTAYNTLHPGLEATASSLLTEDEKKRLRVKPPADAKPAIVTAAATPGKLDAAETPASEMVAPNVAFAAPDTLTTKLAPVLRTLEGGVLVYGMRADIRNTLSPVEDPAPPIHPDEDFYAGAFDLAALDSANTGVYFLEKLVALLQSMHTPFGVIFTPTNHAALHEYIDSPEYQARQLYLEKLVRSHGAAVINLDNRFPAKLFIDEVHLTPAGHAKLADILTPFLQEHAPR